MSSSAYHQQLMSLFDTARELRGGERERFIRDASGGDDQLIRDLTSLLRYDEQPNAFVRRIEAGDGMAVIAPQLGATHEEHAAASLAPGPVGGYRIIQLLAQGGMGAVYLAEQDRPRRHVALKVMRRGLTTPSARQRFEFETEVLARLRHPGVAQIFDAGVHVDADRHTPYFAMEFVPDARGIVAFANERGLLPRERAQLFIRVCEAVHHGHQRGVLHRDLKPDNILVDAEGRPKIIDFGVARAIERDAAGPAQTLDGQMVGTIAYMSPEQVAGRVDEIDVRSDVYSLGVVLYELLLGRLPYAANAALSELVTAIRDGRIVAPRVAQPRFNYDLGLIVTKAIDREPARRYASAAELGTDLRRWLEHEPIAARRASVSYQLAQFARRNKALVGGLAAVLIVLVAGVVAERYRRGQAVEAERAAITARGAAEVEAERAKRVTQFLNDMLKSVTPDEAQGRDVTVREVLDKVATEIDSELDASPAVEASVRLILGQTYYELGLYTEASAMLRAAADLHEKANKQDLETANIYHTLASAELHLEELDGAMRDFDRALSLAKSADPNGNLVLTIMNDRGQVLYLRGDLPGAADNLKEIARLRLARDGEDDSELHSVRANLGIVLNRMGRNTEARDLIAGAHAWYREHQGLTSSETLGTMEALAGVEFSLGNLAEADRLSRECINLHRTHFGADHPELAEKLYLYGTRLANSFREEAAEAVFREALAIRERAIGPESVAVADVLGRLGPVVAKQGRPDEALPLLERAVEIHRAQQPPSDFRLAWALHGYAQALLEARELARARTAEAEAIELLSRASGPESAQTLVARAMLAFIDVNDGRYADARQTSEDVVAIRERILGVDHQETTIGRYNLADVYFGLGEMERAIPLYERSIGRFAIDYGESALLSAARGALSLARIVQGEPEPALEPARQAWEWQRRERKPEHASYGFTAALLVDAACAAGADDAPHQALASAAESAAGHARRGLWRPAYALLVHGEQLKAAGAVEAAQAAVELASDVLERQFGGEHPLAKRAREALHALDPTPGASE